MALVLISGCATMTPERFAANGERMDNMAICSAWNDAVAAENWTFAAEVRREMTKRGLTAETCGSANQFARGLGAFLQGFAAGAIGARQGYVSTYNAVPVDYEWDWDQFYNERYLLVWVCRGVQTGQFVENSKCTGKLMTDWRWPSKRVDAR